MKYKTLILILCAPFFSFSQSFTTRSFGEPAIGVIALSDQFSYNSNLVGHYALGWYHDSWNTGGPSAYLSSYGGIKFFAGGQPRVYLSSSGNFGIGTINGSSRLSILRDFAGEDKTSVAELQMNDTGIDNSMIFLYKNKGGGQPNIEFINARANGTSVFTLNGLGNASLSGDLSIGCTDSKGYKLAVAGSLIAESIRVKLQNDWPDFVFGDDYKLKSLQQVEQYIQNHNHLPGLPPAEDVAEKGIDLGSMSATLLSKIEELTLYAISLKKENEDLKDMFQQLQKQTSRLKKELDKLKNSN